MLKGINKILTGDVLKAICDMGHGETIAIVDGNYPAMSSENKVIQLTGVNTTDVLQAIIDLFPIDIDYTEHPACIMDLTASDKARKMADPETWEDYRKILKQKKIKTGLYKLERNVFYAEAAKSFVIIQTGEERQYGNLILTKGVVL